MLAWMQCTLVQQTEQVWPMSLPQNPPLGKCAPGNILLGEFHLRIVRRAASGAHSGSNGHFCWGSGLLCRDCVFLTVHPVCLSTGGPRRPRWSLLWSCWRPSTCRQLGSSRRRRQQCDLLRQSTGVQSPTPVGARHMRMRVFGIYAAKMRLCSWLLSTTAPVAATHPSSTEVMNGQTN